MKNEKLSLKKLEVTSFVTSMKTINQQTILGGVRMRVAYTEDVHHSDCGSVIPCVGPCPTDNPHDSNCGSVIPCVGPCPDPVQVAIK